MLRKGCVCVSCYRYFSLDCGCWPHRRCWAHSRCYVGDVLKDTESAFQGTPFCLLITPGEIPPRLLVSCTLKKSLSSPGGAGIGQGGPWSTLAHREPLEPGLQIQEQFGQFRSCSAWEARPNPMMVAPVPLCTLAPALRSATRKETRSPPGAPQRASPALGSSSEASPGVPSPQAQRRACSLPWLEPWQSTPQPGSTSCSLNRRRAEHPPR